MVGVVAVEAVEADDEIIDQLDAIEGETALDSENLIDSEKLVDDETVMDVGETESDNTESDE